MDFPIQAPRTDAPALSISPLERSLPAEQNTSVETARPVLAAHDVNVATTTKGEGFQPLDVYEVGDNDHMPVPPEPPREATVLAVMADAQPVNDAAEALGDSDPLMQTLREIDDGPANPTVDIRT